MKYPKYHYFFMLKVLAHQKCQNLGRGCGCGQVVGVLALYSDNPSSNFFQDCRNIKAFGGRKWRFCWIFARTVGASFAGSSRPVQVQPHHCWSLGCVQVLILSIDSNSNTCLLETCRIPNCRLLINCYVENMLMRKIECFI